VHGRHYIRQIVAKDGRRPKNRRRKAPVPPSYVMMMHMTLDRTPSLGMQNQTGVDAPDDEALIARSRAGDAGAVRALVERHAPTVFRIAYRLVGRKAQAEDIAQDVLMRMLDYREGWLSKPGFHVWLRRAVYNRAVDIHRKQRPWAFSALDVVAETSDGAPAQDTALVARESETHVAAAVLELPLRQRMAVTLCFYEQHSLAEAAAVLKVSVGAVESLLHRAKATLKQKLLQQEG
jgi:RNA polymerase sigma-70 factor, ECF subfamily